MPARLRGSPVLVSVYLNAKRNQARSPLERVIVHDDANGIGEHYIRHDENGDRTVTREAYGAEIEKIRQERPDSPATNQIGLRAKPAPSGRIDRAS